MSLALHTIGWWFLISLTLGPVLAWSFFWAAKQEGDELAPPEERKPRLVYSKKSFQWHGDEHRRDREEAKKRPQSG
jgi:hypothetical protein